MSERTERTGSGADQQPVSGRSSRGDDATTVFFADGGHDRPSEDTTQVERPGAPTPPWQRVPQPPHTGQPGQHAGQPAQHTGQHTGQPAHAAHPSPQTGQHAHAAPPSDGARNVQDGPAHAADHGGVRPGHAMADQPTVAEPRPPFGAHNGSNVQNPMFSHVDPQGPPPMHPGHSVPLAGPGAVPVGGLPAAAAAQAAHAPHGPQAPHSGHGVQAGPHQRPPMTSARPTARPAPGIRGRGVRVPRKASLQIRRFDPWSVLKLSVVLSVAMFLMWLVAVGVLYGVLDGMGVWDKVNGAYSDLASVNDETGGGEPLISAGRVFGVSAVVGLVNIVLFTAFATVSAFVYNVSADLAGGIEVTLSERD